MSCKDHMIKCNHRIEQSDWSVNDSKQNGGL